MCYLTCQKQQKLPILSVFTLFLIIIILRPQSCRPQVSSIDGGFEPFPTADYLASFQDPPEDNEYKW